MDKTPLTLGKWTFVLVLTMACLLSCMALGAGGDEGPLPALDAHIAGTVVNGTSGMHVEVSSFFDLTPTNPDDPQNNKLRYFNGTTDPTGSFNITVDSNATGNEYLILIHYSVVVYPTYYLGMNKGFFSLPHYMETGETYHIPTGELEAFTEETGELKVRIMNASGGIPIEDAVVTIEHVGQVPDPPFDLARSTDANGEVIWTDIRSVNTTVEATKLHFQDLSETEDRNWVVIGAAGQTYVSFDLEEDPWPFTTDPTDGASDVNVTEGIATDFGRVMDSVAITDPDNYRLYPVGGTDLELIFDPSPDRRMVDILTAGPLAYNTSFVLRLDTGLITTGGGHPLWRAMEVQFRTELPPGAVTGRLVDSKNGAPAWGAKLLLSDQRTRSGEDGDFTFPLVPKGTYRLDVLDSYLYNETSISGIAVEKGSLVDIGTIEVDPKPWGSLEVTVVSEVGPIGGATVKVLSSMLEEDDFRETTDPMGKVAFDRVRAGNVNLEGSAPRHAKKIDIANVVSGRENAFTLTLKEDPLPVTVEATLPLGEGTVDPRTDLLIRVPEEIKFQSLSVGLWTLNASGQRDDGIDLAAPAKGSEPLTYEVNIPGSLPMETDFEFAIEDTLLALDDLSPVLWRDVVFRFSTPDLALSFISGTLLLEGSPYEGLILSFGPFSTATGDDGGFNLTVNPSGPSTTYELTTDTADIGYADLGIQMTVAPGEVKEVGTFSLPMLPGWYTVVPADGALDVEPNANITFSFLNPVRDNGEGWNKLLKVVPEGSSAPIAGDYETATGNRTIVFTPGNDLSEGTTYRVEASDRIGQLSGRPALPVGNVTTFTIRQPLIVITLISPEAGELGSLPLDTLLEIEFSTRVNTTIVTSSFQLEPRPAGLGFDWPSSSKVRISALFKSGTEHSLLLPVGKYGTNGEPLKTPFSLTFTMGSSYERTHEPESLQIIPEKSWTRSSEVRMTGLATDSVGYEVKVLLKKGEETVEHGTIVLSDGRFNLSFKSPDSTGDYEMVLTIGIPDGPIAYERSYRISVKEGQEGKDGEGTDALTIAIATALILFIAAIVAGGLIFMKRQRKDLSKRSDIEYTEVDSDWSSEE